MARFTSRSIAFLALIATACGSTINPSPQPGAAGGESTGSAGSAGLGGGGESSANAGAPPAAQAGAATGEGGATPSEGGVAGTSVAVNTSGGVSGGGAGGGSGGAMQPPCTGPLVKVSQAGAKFTLDNGLVKATIDSSDARAVSRVVDHQP